jgi:hypothetical protein
VRSTLVMHSCSCRSSSEVAQALVEIRGAEKETAMQNTSVAQGTTLYPGQERRAGRRVARVIRKPSIADLQFAVPERDV